MHGGGGENDDGRPLSIIPTDIYLYIYLQRVIIILKLLIKLRHFKILQKKTATKKIHREKKNIEEKYYTRILNTISNYGIVN